MLAWRGERVHRLRAADPRDRLQREAGRARRRDRPDPVAVGQRRQKRDQHAVGAQLGDLLGVRRRHLDHQLGRRTAPAAVSRQRRARLDIRLVGDHRPLPGAGLHDHLVPIAAEACARPRARARRGARPQPSPSGRRSSWGGGAYRFGRIVGCGDRHISARSAAIVCAAVSMTAPTSTDSPEPTPMGRLKGGGATRAAPEPRCRSPRRSPPSWTWWVAATLTMLCGRRVGPTPAGTGAGAGRLRRVGRSGRRPRCQRQRLAGQRHQRLAGDPHRRLHLPWA